jgi:DNA-directed RNA polymerase alpha subunit
MIHIEALSTMAKKQTDPIVIRMAVNDWRVRHSMAAQEKEPVAIDAYLAALRLEREAVQQARAINTKEYERLQNQVISSAGTLALAEQLRSQLEQARALLNEATLKSMALETRRESLPIYRVTILGRGE